MHIMQVLSECTAFIDINMYICVYLNTHTYMPVYTERTFVCMHVYANVDVY